ncbi:hypothetical protein E2C01_002950 [Portunus trituberculatus]|uniref:Uncharacterized protein n=1 Tax=Portunus trituberculatus TaxID=210409 RepID=A0A5B7CL28_PORTR|nr:hypothetical protein [Portunus trituberculatus]
MCVDVMSSCEGQEQNNKKIKRKAANISHSGDLSRHYHSDLSHKTDTRFPYYATRQHVSLFSPVLRVKTLPTPFTSQQPTLPCLTVGLAGH